MRKPGTGMLTNSQIGLIPRDTILFVGDATDKVRDFSDSDKKCAENFGVDYMDAREFVQDYDTIKMIDDI